MKLLIKILSLFGWILFPIPVAFLGFTFFIAFLLRIPFVDHFFRWTRRGFEYKEIDDHNKRNLLIQPAIWLSTTPEYTIEFIGDGEEGPTVNINFWLIAHFHIGIANMLPLKWFPKSGEYKGEMRYWAGKEWGIAAHHHTSWFSWGNDIDGHCLNPGIQVTFNLMDEIKGKHTCRWFYKECQTFILPMLEGNYQIQIFRKTRIDTWQRWPKKVREVYEAIPGQWTRVQSNSKIKDYSIVKAGTHYYETKPCKIKYKNAICVNELQSPLTRNSIESQLKVIPVPFPGKGTAAHNCGEDANFSTSFGIGKVNSFQQAFLAYQKSIHKTRLQYGGSKWTPGKFDITKIKIIRK